MRLSSLLLGAWVIAASAAAISAPHPHLRPMILEAGSGRLAPGSQKLLCHRKRAPAHGMEVGRVKFLMPGDGGYHVALLRPQPGKLEWPARECPFLHVPTDPWESIARSQHPVLDWRLPPGVAIRLEPRQPLLIQTHYLRPGDGTHERRRWKTKTELYPVDPATVTAHAGMLVLDDRVPLYDLPRGRSVETSRCTVTGEDAEARELRVIGLGGHYHFHGSAIEAYRVKADGSLGELLYGFAGFDQPDFRQYSDDPIVLHPGEGIEWRCTYDVNNYYGRFCPGLGPCPQEHCLLFGAYYPTDTPQEAIHCVHHHDLVGGDVVTRTLVP